MLDIKQIMKNENKNKNIKNNVGYPYYEIFPFNFHLPKNGLIFKPYCYYNKRVDKYFITNRRNNNIIPIGYAMFKYEKGILKGFCDCGMSMGFVEGSVKIWEYPPTHYFKPNDGYFIVKTTRTYKDFKFEPDTIRDRCKFTQLYPNKS